MNRRHLLWGLLAIGACVPPPILDPGAAIHVAELRRHVEYLASDGMRGRDNDTPEGRRAAEYVALEMERIGLEAAGTEGYFHSFTVERSKNDLSGINVAGRLTGTDPALRGEVVVVNAHHDHLGVVGGEVMNGADDNATGVAALLEVAEAIAAVRGRLRRTVVFVSFDCEEDGLFGSRRFVKEKVVDPDAIVANVCLDMLGGDMHESEVRRLYALGQEWSPELSALVAGTSVEGLEVVAMPIAVIEPHPLIARSDYASFRAARIPFIFLSTGTPWCYHTQYDDVEYLNFPKLEKAARYCLRLAMALATTAERPRVKRPAHLVTVGQLGVLREGLELAVAEADELGFSEEEKARTASMVERVTAHIEAGETGNGALTTARAAVVHLFRAARRGGPVRR